MKKQLSPTRAGACLKLTSRTSIGFWYSLNILSYEPEIWYVADRFLDPSTIFVDCGANLGLWSCFAASKIGEQHAQVIAVEPGESVLQRLRRNRQLNHEGFSLLECAISDRSGETRSEFADLTKGIWGELYGAHVRARIPRLVFTQNQRTDRRRPTENRTKHESLAHQQFQK